MHASVLIFLYVLVFSTFTFSTGQDEIQCYQCSTSAHDLTCLESPDDVNHGGTLVPCPNNGYCTIVRTEYTDIPGKVVGFVRDCDKDPLIRNQVRSDAHYTKHYTVCRSNKCNKGNGIILGSSEGGPVSGAIIVPAESASTSLQSSYYILITIAIFAVYNN